MTQVWTDSQILGGRRRPPTIPLSDPKHADISVMILKSACRWLVKVVRAANCKRCFRGRTDGMSAPIGAVYEVNQPGEAIEIFRGTISGLAPGDVTGSVKLCWTPGPTIEW